MHIHPPCLLNHMRKTPGCCGVNPINATPHQTVLTLLYWSCLHDAVRSQRLVGPVCPCLVFDSLVHWCNLESPRHHASADLLASRESKQLATGHVFYFKPFMVGKLVPIARNAAVCAIFYRDLVVSGRPKLIRRPFLQPGVNTGTQSCPLANAC